MAAAGRSWPVGLWILFAGFCFPPSLGAWDSVQHPAKSDASLSLLVVGDWGRRGHFNQSRVAAQMGVIGEELDVDFVISTGDNFYDDGLAGTDDTAFQASFSKIYTAPSLQKPWYTVLGNHDYRGNVEAQLSPILREMDSRWVCFRSFILNAEIVDFFFVDTTPMVDKYFSDPEEHVYDWSGVLPRNKYVSSLLKDLDDALKQSTSKWKIVVGHHTLRSAGHHGDTDELVDLLLPILLENNVDLYVNGHDHCLQHISNFDSPLQFLTSGGGSKAWRGDVDESDEKKMKFYHDGQGFMSMLITESHMEIAFYDLFGSILHKWTTYDQLYSNS